MGYMPSVNSARIQDGQVGLADLADGTAAGQILAWTGSGWVRENRALVSSLPVSPFDGQICYYQNAAMAAKGIVWAFRYDAGSASAYKWSFIGGAELSDLVTTNQTTSSTTYAALATAGPAVTVPLSGDWIVGVEGALYHNNNFGSAFMSFDIGATPAVDADGRRHGNPVGDNTAVSEGRRSVEKTGLSASTVLTAKYKTVAAGTAGFINRKLAILPIRVG